MESRPNFSPRNICSSNSRTGSRVAYGKSNSSRPPRSSISMRSLITMAALEGREMVANRGFVSSRSKRNVTGLNGSKAALKSLSIT